MVAFLTAIVFFLQLRIADEFKDASEKLTAEKTGRRCSLAQGENGKYREGRSGKYRRRVEHLKASHHNVRRFRNGDTTQGTGKDVRLALSGGASDCGGLDPGRVHGGASALYTGDEVVQREDYLLPRRPPGRRVREQRVQRRAAGGSGPRPQGAVHLFRLGSAEDDSAVQRGGCHKTRRDRRHGASRRCRF